MEQCFITEVTELTKVAKTVLLHIQKRKANNQSITLALHGELGAGKTTFTQVLATELGVTETVTSPTFVIMKLYELSNQTFQKLVHIDAYRIEDDDEMRVLGFDSLLEEEGALICIEWAENISSLLPEDTIHLTFTVEEQGRKITIA